ncbi:MAG: 5'-3' exonuclease H3TH domain-containing protein [Candidatus Gracilibacteria bacterium]
MEDKEKFILIDGSGLVYRGFYAVPPFFKSPKGVQTNAVFGFANILLSLLTTQKPQYIAVAFDKKGPTFRHKEFAEYKATRVKAPQELYDQIPLVKTLVQTLGIPLFETAGFEADDIIAAISKGLSSRNNFQTLIATGDFDLFQLVNKNTAILYPAKGFKLAETMHLEDVIKKYSLTPEQIPDYKGLAGDHSDNIPGVMGIGEKGAKDLLSKYKTLENIYEHIGEITGAMKKKLEAGKESAFMSKHLATLCSDMPVDFDLMQCKVKDLNVKALKELFAEYGFKSLIKRLDDIYGTESMSAQSSLF